MKAKNVGHTSTLWSFDGHNGIAAPSDQMNGGYFTALCQGTEKDENAAFIVRACNVHDELVGVLKDCRKLFEIACGTEAPYIREMFKTIDAALAKAEPNQ